MRERKEGGEQQPRHQAADEVIAQILDEGFAEEFLRMHAKSRSSGRKIRASSSNHAQSLTTLSRNANRCRWSRNAGKICSDGHARGLVWCARTPEASDQRLAILPLLCASTPVGRKTQIAQT